MQVKWADFTFPAINLYSYPKQTKDFMNDKIVWKPKVDMINKPPHYDRGGVMAWDVIEAWSLNFNLGNTLKYISRAGHKNDKLEDLKKARAYLDREIMLIEKQC